MPMEVDMTEYEATLMLARTPAAPARSEDELADVAEDVLDAVIRNAKLRALGPNVRMDTQTATLYVHCTILAANPDEGNAIVVRDEHVVLGWGRDYGDVSPVQGVILGGGAHSLEVSVDLEPAGED